MAANKWTTEQQAAISARGCDLLVAAAAGSGKTAVLVERIITRITTDTPPLDIDRLLVVTFTKAAAAEMSQRIGTAIAKQLEQEPQNVHLQNQMTLLARADIKTIHAFCLQIIKEYYHALDIDPGVRTADEGEVRLLQQEVLEDYFEELYSEENAEFFRLLETFGEETKDTRLKKLILQLYQFAQGYPDPVDLLGRMAEQFHLSEEESVDHCLWMPLIQESVRGNVQFARYLLSHAMKIASATVGFEGYLKTLEKEDTALERLEEAVVKQGYRQWHEAYVAIDFARLPSYRGQEKETAEEIKSLRTEAKDAVKKMGETYFCYGEEMQSQLIRSLYPVAKALAETTMGFMERFAQAKKEKLIIDFHDYEHFALHVLVEKGSTLSAIRPTAMAQEVQERYDEIMIDEYQDSNMVQEMILSAVSGESTGKNNRFMVGDVKQSIYRFRLAMPELFNEKYGKYPLEAGGKTRKIVLAKNFRSRGNILEGANFLFRQMMSASFGDVEYDDQAALYTGAKFPETELFCGGENEVLLAETQGAEESDLPEELEEMNRRQLEANLIVNRIRQLMAEGYHVLDKESGDYRPLEFRDIAILMRSVRSWGSVLDDVFGNGGIPFYAETSEGYYDVPEVDTILNFLRLLDNPRQDIPLLSVLHSPIYGLSADELMQIRLAGGDGLFLDCLAVYGEVGEEGELREKIAGFLADLAIYRTQVRELSLHELLRYVYEKSGYYDFVGMMAGGGLRQANLRLLLEKAEQYEKGSRKGLFFFIRYVEDLKTAEEDTSAAKLQSEADNLVRVMTIHKSKGLEFPVVFVADTGKLFNEMDAREAVITHQAWGFGMDYKDLEQRAVYRTLSKTALAEAIRLENLAEEMRVLYVALTRAKEKLILTGFVKDRRKSLEKWLTAADTTEDRLPVFRLRRARCYLDWVMPALLRHPCGKKWLTEETLSLPPKVFTEEASRWSIAIENREEIMERAIEEAEMGERLETDFLAWDTETDYSGQRTEIFALLSWQYPYGGAAALPAKISISEIKRKHVKELTGEPPLPVGECRLFSLEKKEKTALTAAEIGTAMHTVMEEADLRLEYTTESLEALIEALVKKGRLSPLEASCLRRQELLTFFASPLAKRIRKAERIEKERQFAALMETKELFLDEKYRSVEEKVLINGIIDCFFIENGEIILLDYKSDRVYEEDVLRQRYAIQLGLYQKALERATGLPVGEVYLYAFAMGRAVPLTR